MFKFSNTADSSYANDDLMQLVTLSNIPGCKTETAEKLRCAMDNVAKAMSKAIRNLYSTWSLGTTTSQEMTIATHVSIHWQWIALLVLEWLLGLIPLLGAMWKTRRTGIPTWQNDLMTVLSLIRDRLDEKSQGSSAGDREGEFI